MLFAKDSNLKSTWLKFVKKANYFDLLKRLFLLERRDSTKHQHSKYFGDMRNPSVDDFSSQPAQRQNYYTLTNPRLSSNPASLSILNSNRSSELLSSREESFVDDYYNIHDNSDLSNRVEEVERNNFRGDQTSIDLVARSCHPWNVPFDNRLHHKVEKGFASEILVYKVPNSSWYKCFVFRK